METGSRFSNLTMQCQTHQFALPAKTTMATITATKQQRKCVHMGKRSKTR